MTDELLVDEPKRLAWQSGDVYCFAISGLGKPLCQLAWALMDELPLPPPDKMKVKFDEGHTLEPEIFKRLEAKGWKVTHYDEDQVEVKLELGPRVLLVGHPDGDGVPQGRTDKRVVEAKALGPDLFKQAQSPSQQVKMMSKLGYDYQISAYALAMQQPATMVFGEKGADGDQILRLHTKDFALTDLPRSKEEMLQKCMAAVVMAQGGEPICPPKGTANTWPCPYYHLGDCGQGAKDRVADDNRWAGLEKVDEPKLKIAFAKYAAADRRAREAAKIKKAAREQLDRELAGRTEVRVGSFGVSFDPGQQRVDFPKLEEFLAEHDRDLDEFREEGAPRFKMRDDLT